VDFPLSTSCEAVDRADATLLLLFISNLTYLHPDRHLFLQDLPSFYFFYVIYQIKKKRNGYFLQIIVELASRVVFPAPLGSIRP
jgi:hypothetical protein